MAFVAPKIEAAPHTEMQHHHQCLIFPRGFLWGAATSAHQVEGGNIHNDWWNWEQKKGRIKDGSVSGKATDHYRLFEKDFDLAKELQQNAHRLSLEWSRIEPTRGQWDEDAILHYKNVLTALKKRGFTVMLTLHHFTLPRWFADRGGWLHQKALKDWQRFVAKAINEYAPLVDLWITINEPNVYATQGYTYGVWPPEKKSTWLHLRVLWRLARVHNRAYSLIHRQKADARVGIAQNMMSMETYNKHSLIDFSYLCISLWLWNRLFYFLTGKKTHDFIGINYYIHQRIKRQGLRFIKFIDNRGESREHSDMGWEVYPNGIFEVVMDAADFGLPIYITESGIAAENDRRRMRYIVNYLRHLYYAIRAGAAVKGYFHWSLLDNFEWAEGFAMRFGLIHVDHQTKKRVIKKSAKVYRDIARENTLCHRFFKLMGHMINYEDIPKTD